MCSLVFSLLYLHYLRQEKKKLTFGAQHHRLCLFMYVVWVKDRLTNSLLLLCATFFFFYRRLLSVLVFFFLILPVSVVFI